MRWTLEIQLQPSIKTYVEDLGLSAGNTYRGDCPACGGKNTFTATKKGRELIWNCYRSSCLICGRANVKLGLSEARIALTPVRTDKKFELPEHFISPLRSEAARTYLRKYHCLPAYADGRALIKYDPQLDRIVFVTIDEHTKPLGATGRALKQGAQPKWLRYDSAKHLLFTCRGKEFPAIGVIVEDATSATAVSGSVSGIALLGTSISEVSSSLNWSNYKKIIIALDKDASKKALELQQRIGFHCPAFILLLDDDLKYYNPEQIRKKLEKFL